MVLCYPTLFAVPFVLWHSAELSVVMANVQNNWKIIKKMALK
jgi:hypothetical protein